MIVQKKSGVARGCLTAIGAVVVLIVVLIVIVAALGSKGSKSLGPGQGNSVHPAAGDVTISSCVESSNQFEGPSATLAIMNHSSKPSDYIVQVAFDSPDGATQLDTATAIVNNLGAGQNTTTDAASVNSNLRGQQFECKIVSVDRTASTP